MISVDEAQARILAALAPLPAEEVPLPQALGRVLAEDVTARADPAAGRGLGHGRLRRARAPMSARSPATLTVVGERAGRAAPSPARSGRARPCASSPARRCPTAPTPSSSRRTRSADGRPGPVREAAAPGRFVRAGRPRLRGRRRSGCAAGRVLTRARHRPRRRHEPALAAACAAGRASAILATGDELVMPGRAARAEPDRQLQRPRAGRLRRGLGRRAGRSRHRAATIARRSRAPSRPAPPAPTCWSPPAAPRSATTTWSQAALGATGMALDFWKIAMRPGKPLMFGRSGATPVLGLPGNPVSLAGLRDRVPAAGPGARCSACRRRRRSADAGAARPRPAGERPPPGLSARASWRATRRPRWSPRPSSSRTARCCRCWRAPAAS